MNQEKDLNSTGSLKPEDYVEPRCVLCGDPYGTVPETKPIPQQRVAEKLDEYMAKKDYDGAERHLKYWLEEARLGSDLRGQLTVCNEMIGFYRKRGQEEGAFEAIGEALKLLGELGFENNLSAGTTYTNAATAYYRFGDYEKALSFFEKAKTVYEASDNTRPDLSGGLYNNMALVCVALARYEQAADLYRKALSIMEQLPEGKPEQAITWLNLANALEAQKGMEEAEPEIFRCLDKAEQLLDEAQEYMLETGVPAEGYYAFVCESCAPTFSYYGYFLTAQELERRAKEIYERA